MWEVRNRTPFAAAGAFARNQDGREIWCVAVRATFQVIGGVVRLAEAQEDVRLAPIYDDDTNTMLLSDPDITAFVPGTDVLLRGVIKAPEVPTDARPLQLSLGPITKRAILRGPRKAMRGIFGWSVEDQQPVTDTQISWRNCFGGTLPPPANIWHPANPVGLGIEMRGDVDRGTVINLPCLDTPEADILETATTANPTGFGAIQRHWAPRQHLAGTYDAAWEAEHAPLLPNDYDLRFAQSAPRDQTTPEHLKGGETATLSGFGPDGPLSFRLPQVILDAKTMRRRIPIESRFALIRVEIDPGAGSLGMVWTTHVPCNGDDAGLAYSRVRVKQMSGVTA